MQAGSIRKCLKTVTVTGADDSVDPMDLVSIADEYPFVEFGILLSRNAMGGVRFPSAKWLNEASSLLFGSVRCSGHLCDEWVRETLCGNFPTKELSAINPLLPNVFTRWQINTHGLPHEWLPRELYYGLYGLKLKQEVIFQYDEVNTPILEWAIEEKQHVSALFDLSHGAGILPDQWEKPDLSCTFGFAGGLSPENLAVNLPLIADVSGKGTWIDAETHLRSDNDKVFDLGKVCRFLEIAQPYVMN